jgi:lambda family phage portal protein
MNWFDKYVIAPFAPKAALRRISARRALKAYYEAGEPSTARKRRTDRASANTNGLKAGENIRATARYLDENYDIAAGALDVLVANTVGSGIWPEPQILLKDGTPATDANRQLLSLFEDWRFKPDVTWQYDYFGLQRICARSAFRDGEVFANRVTGPVSGIDHGTIVPYSIEALESDFVPWSLEGSAPQVIQGIEVNDWGRPVAYRVYKRHPGESGGRVLTMAGLFETKRVPATTMMHVAYRKRLHQLRGISLFASVANRLEDIKQIDECELIAAKVAASMAAYIKKGNPDGYESPADPSKTGRRLMQMEAGLIFDDLEQGEDIGTIDTKRPNNALIPFRDSHLRAVASGMGSSFSSISKNYNGTYSAQRQELVEHYQMYQMIAGPIIYGFCQPVWDGFVDAAMASGALVLPANVDRATLWDCTHTGPAMPWIDPEKEVNARVTAMQWKLTSRSRVIRESGKNPDQINREIVHDQEQAGLLGIDISGPQTVREEPKKDPAEEERPRREREQERDAMMFAAMKHSGDSFAAAVAAMPPPTVTVNNAPTEVNVAPPVVNVQPEISIPAPIVNVQPPDVHVAAPVVHVAAPPPRRTEKTIVRDSNGKPFKLIEEEVEQ